MKIKTSTLAVAALVAGSICAFSASALPGWGVSEVVFYQYYTDASMLEEAGARVIGQDNDCDPQRVDWGQMTPHRRLIRETCVIGDW